MDPRVSSMTCCRRPAGGFTLIEVLVTLLVLAFGLLGLSGLQSRLTVAQMEGYQRSQALLLLEDMASRIAANRSATSLAAYVAGAPITAPLGAAMTCPTLGSTPTRVQRDLRAWCLALQGAAESTGEGATRVGGADAARGCVESLGNDRYLVTVAWRGAMPSRAPGEGLACGADLYDGGDGSGCSEDRCRRVVSTVVRIGSLS